jgi:hypothetical protein
VEDMMGIVSGIEIWSGSGIRDPQAPRELKPPRYRAGFQLFRIPDYGSLIPTEFRFTVRAHPSTR